MEPRFAVPSGWLKFVDAERRRRDYRTARGTRAVEVVPRPAAPSTDYSLDLRGALDPWRDRAERRGQDDPLPPPLGLPAADERDRQFRRARTSPARRRIGSPGWGSGGRSRTSACSATCRSSITSWSRSSERHALVGRDSAARRPRSDGAKRSLRGRRGRPPRPLFGLAPAATAWPAACRTATSVAWRSRAPSASQPQILLLDEPNAGMNPIETQELLGLIRRLRDELVDHDRPRRPRHPAGHGPVRPHPGPELRQLIAEGDPAAVRANPEVIAAYLGQARHA